MTQRPAPFLSLHAAPELVALCAPQSVPDLGDVGTPSAPDWIHILPVGTVETIDGRGPYRIADAAALARDSLEAAGGRLVLDENHATDLAAPKGEPAPARGWITDLQARADGIWGKVDWTKAGAALMADRAYRHISPAILHRADGEVIAILRASLVNRPNLRGLAALHLPMSPEITMDPLKAIAAALGLAETASLADVLGSINTRQAAPQASLQAALSPIALAIGLSADADAAAVLAGVQALKPQEGSAATVTALQAELLDLGQKFASLQQATATEKAKAFVDGEIQRGRVGVKPLRDHYIAMHAADPARVEKEIGALPILGPSGLSSPPPSGADGDAQLSLNADQLKAARLLGLDPKLYADTWKAERQAAL